jgi:tetratricopeptide (TPR) repeat protein
MEAQSEILSARKMESAALRYAGNAALLGQNYEMALEHYLSSLAITTSEDDFIGWLDAKQGLRNTLVISGDISSALDVISEISGVLAKEEEKYIDLIFVNYHYLLIVVIQCGHFEEAIRLSKNMFKIAENNFPKNHINFSLSLYNIALASLETGDYISSEQEAKSYLAHLEQTNCLDSIRAIPGFYILGKSERLLEKFNVAEKSHIQCLKFAGKYLPAGHQQLGLSFNELGLVHQNLMRFEEAEQDFKMAVDLERSNKRSNTPDSANYAANLGRFFGSQGRWKEASVQLTTAAEIRHSALGSTHPKTIEVSLQRDDVERILNEKQPSEILIPIQPSIVVPWHT